MGNPELARIFTAAVIGGFGAFLWARPCYASPRPYFKCVGRLALPERGRIDRVLDARDDAEDIPAAYGRYLALAVLGLGLLELLPAVPPVLPYALMCLVMAGFTLLAYLRFRRATDRRVAPLVRRSPVHVLSPFGIAAMACSFVAVLAVAAYPPQRLEALVGAVAMAVLVWVAWRIAQAPALLLGDDPQWEYAVDERIRVCRARNVTVLVCATGALVVAFAQPYASAVFYPVYAAFAVAGATYAHSVMQSIRTA